MLCVIDRMYLNMKGKMQEWISCLEEKLPAQPGSGVVELVLIIVVLIAMVLIFKSNLQGLLHTIFSQIESSASSIF